MLLFVDTETTGLLVPNGDLASQPHLVQLALVTYSEDAIELGSFSTIISPEGQFTIPDKASAIHGITTSLAEASGISLHGAIRVYAENAKHSSRVIAHNWNFDREILRCALARAYPNMPWSPPDAFCTMEAALPILALPPTPSMVRAGRMNHKSPRLSECYEFFFNEPLVGAHDALVDVRACARVYFHMRDEGMLS